MTFNAKRKLNSKHGATLLLALLMFLVCAVVASVIITAAYSTAARTTQNKNTQQNYLSVMSASRLLRDYVNDMSFEAYYVKTVTETRIPQYGSIPKLDINGNPVLDENGDAVYEEAIVGYEIQEDTEYSYGTGSLSNNVLLPNVAESALLEAFLYNHAPSELYNGSAPGNYVAKVTLQLSDEEELFDSSGFFVIFCRNDAQKGINTFDICLEICDKNGGNLIVFRCPAQVVDIYQVVTETYDNSVVNKFVYGINVSWSDSYAEKGGRS